MPEFMRRGHGKGNVDRQLKCMWVRIPELMDTGKYAFTDLHPDRGEGPHCVGCLLLFSALNDCQEVLRKHTAQKLHQRAHTHTLSPPTMLVCRTRGTESMREQSTGKAGREGHCMNTEWPDRRG